MFPAVVVVSLTGLTVLLYAIIWRDARTWVVMLIAAVVMGALALLVLVAKGYFS